MDGFIPVERVKDELDELLRRVEGGESVSLTRDGQVVARLQPPVPGPIASRIRANRVGRSLNPASPAHPSPAEVVDAFHSLQDRLSLDGLTIKELINEGRR